MAKYMFEAKYSVEGAKGIAKAGGTARRAAVEKSVASAGGRVETFYFAFGGRDAFVICDFPNCKSSGRPGDSRTGATVIRLQHSQANQPIAATARNCTIMVPLKPA